MALLVCSAALLVGAWPDPPWAPPGVMAATGLIIFVMGLFATQAIAEYVAALTFFALALLLGIAAPATLFAGFESSALWLVFGGLVLGGATGRTGLGRYLAARMVERLSGSYLRTVAALVLACLVLAFLVPSAMGRLVMLVPITIGIAERFGFGHEHPGRIGMVCTVVFATYLVPIGVLPSNLVNAVLMGAASASHGIDFTFGRFLLLHFPVLGVLKGLLLIVLVRWLYPVTTRMDALRSEEPAPLTTEGKRLLFILLGALALWMTDTWHGIAPGWVALFAAVACLLPRIGVLDDGAFREEVSLPTLLYVAGVLAVGQLISSAGVEELLARLVIPLLPLDAATPGLSVMSFSLLAVLVSLFATMPGTVAMMTPLAGAAASLSGVSVETFVMAIVPGISTPFLAYQAAPMVVGLHLARVSMGQAARVLAPLAALSLLLLPINVWWWRLIGFL